MCTGWGTYPGAFFGSVFQEQVPSCVLVGVLTRERASGACFRSKLPRVYRLGLHFFAILGRIMISATYAIYPSMLNIDISVLSSSHILSA